jgi:hypothetical protein
MNMVGWSFIIKYENLINFLKKRIFPFIFIVIGIPLLYLVIFIFNLKGPAINWISILVTVLIVFVGLYLITRLKIFNIINSFIIGIWLIITPFEISILNDGIFFMLILFLPIGLFVLIFGFTELMKDGE